MSSARFFTCLIISNLKRKGDMRTEVENWVHSEMHCTLHFTGPSTDTAPDSKHDICRIFYTSIFSNIEKFT